MRQHYGSGRCRQVHFIPPTESRKAPSHNTRTLKGTQAMVQRVVRQSFVSINWNTNSLRLFRRFRFCCFAQISQHIFQRNLSDVAYWERASTKRLAWKWRIINTPTSLPLCRGLNGFALLAFFILIFILLLLLLFVASSSSFQLHSKCVFTVNFPDDLMRWLTLMLTLKSIFVSRRIDSAKM